MLGALKIRLRMHKQFLLNGQNTSIETFTAPTIAGNVSSNSYLFELTVMDNDGLFGSDTNKVVVSHSEEQE